MDTETSRVRSSLRIQYDAQIAVIQRQIGGLEEVRDKLALSQRKMAQLLMVDPSAWTRWIADETRVPPHIWRALQWYLGLQEKIPGLTPQYFLGGDAKHLQARIEQNLALKMDDKIQQSRANQSELLNAANITTLKLHNEVKFELQNQVETLRRQNRRILVLIWLLVCSNLFAAFWFIRGI